MSREASSIAVALHDVAPANLEKCALIRDWLSDHGVGAVTLLVVPGADGDPALDDWLHERRAAGDAVAHGGPPGPAVRLDLHPADFEHTRRVHSIERALEKGVGAVGGSGIRAVKFLLAAVTAAALTGLDAEAMYLFWPL